MARELEHGPGLHDALQQANEAKTFAEQSFEDLAEKNIAVERAVILDQYATNIQIIENKYNQLIKSLNDSHADNVVISQASALFQEAAIYDIFVHNNAVDLIDNKFNSDIELTVKAKEEKVSNADTQYEEINQGALRAREDARNNATNDTERANADAQYIQKIANNWEEHAKEVAEIEVSFLQDMSEIKQTYDESLIAATLLYQEATENEFAAYMQTTADIEEQRGAELNSLEEAKSLEIQQATDIRDAALNAAFTLGGAIF